MTWPTLFKFQGWYYFSGRQGTRQTINKLITSAAKVGAVGQRSQGSKWEKIFQVVGTKRHLQLGQNHLFETNYKKMKTGSPHKFGDHLPSLFSSQGVVFIKTYKEKALLEYAAFMLWCPKHSSLWSLQQRRSMSQRQSLNSLIQD